MFAKRIAALTFATLLMAAPVSYAQDWFERFKDTASDDDLLRLMTLLPKGGDLHNHITGAVHSEWFWELALAAKEKGYRYYTKIKINNCRYGTNEYGPNRYLLLFRTIPETEYKRLNGCEQAEYVPLEQLTGAVRDEWLDSLRLNESFEGRAEFFEALWPRIGGMLQNPHLVGDLLVKNMQAFGAEGLLYLEAQIPVHGMRDPTGQPIPIEQVANIYRARIAQEDAVASGVTVRLQLAVLRFLPNAEAFLERIYRFVHDQELFVGVNMVGREDNDKGYPLRFLKTLRMLRRTVGDVPLAIHAGEVDEPNQHIRDTLLLGADRIGHGVNLITDPDTLILMRNGPYLVEINLISNLLLEYIQDYDQHPFPEYLRIDVPVALSTDDRGMWNSTLSDEYFVAVKEFDLTWAEVRKLSRNALSYAFLEEPAKAALLEQLEQRLGAFERRAQANLPAFLESAVPQYRGFLCRRYDVCGTAQENN